MIGAEKLLGQLLGDNNRRNLTSGVGGMAGGYLLGRSGKKMRKRLIKYGALAAIGGLAYAAFQNYQSKKSGGTAAAATAEPVIDKFPVDNRFVPPAGDSAARNDLGLLLMRAMIAAARADGHIDAQETEAIFGKMDQLELSPQDKAAVLEELGRPADVDRLIAAARTPELAAEIYVATRMAIEIDTPQEQRYVQNLTRRLKLEPALVDELERQIEAA